MELVPGRIMIFGVFDHFHSGHRSFIEQARSEAKELVIAVACDANALRFKVSLRHSEQERLQALQKRYPDLKIILGDEFDPLTNVKKYRPEKVCLGYDQIGFSQELRERLPEVHIEHMRPFKGQEFK